MPRRPRPDLHPTIWVPDTADAQRRARDAVGSRFGVSVHERGRTVPYTRYIDAFHDWVRFLRSEGETIDHEVLNCMTGHLSFADARAQGSANEEGVILHILFMPGCRATITQRGIADELGCSEERVRLAIKQLKRCEIIVNTGKGWYEFDATFFWKGAESIRLAYVPVQSTFMRTEIYDN